jgi:hypothetical protein
MLRTAVLVFAFLAVAVGAYLCTKGGAASIGGIQALVSGVVILIGTLFERWRYKTSKAAADGHWQVTAERFVDPESGREMEVLYDPDSGERRYREIR